MVNRIQRTMVKGLDGDVMVDVVCMSRHNSAVACGHICSQELAYPQSGNQAGECCDDGRRQSKKRLHGLNHTSGKQVNQIQFQAPSLKTIVHLCMLNGILSWAGMVSATWQSPTVDYPTSELQSLSPVVDHSHLLGGIAVNVTYQMEAKDWLP